MNAAVLAFSLVLASQVFLSQSSPALGHFRGVVQDVKGSKIREARITVTGEAGFQKRFVSNKKGQFELYLLPGIYRILVEKSGFANYELTHLEIKSNASEEFVFKLERRNPQS